MRKLRAALACGIAALACGAAAAPAAGAIHPGVVTRTDGGQCTSNFVFSDASNVYLGQAAHCAAGGQATDTNGCTTPSLPLGTPVTIDGATRPGTLAYSSWLTMQSVHERDANACRYNDFALIRIDPADAPNVSPTLPFFGGPHGLNTTGTQPGDPVRSYGNSMLRFGVQALSPKEGISLGDTGDGWSHTVLTVTPGIPGDSGSAFIDGSGRALGVLSTLNVIPLAGSNGVSDLSRMLAYMRAHSDLRATLRDG